MIYIKKSNLTCFKSSLCPFKMIGRDPVYCTVPLNGRLLRTDQVVVIPHARSP